MDNQCLVGGAFAIRRQVDSNRPLWKRDCLKCPVSTPESFKREAVWQVFMCLTGQICLFSHHNIGCHALLSVNVFSWQSQTPVKDPIKHRRVWFGMSSAPGTHAEICFGAQNRVTRQKTTSHYGPVKEDRGNIAGEMESSPITEALHRFPCLSSGGGGTLPVSYAAAHIQLGFLPLYIFFKKWYAWASSHRALECQLCTQCQPPAHTLPCSMETP